ncbi:pre-mRNA cleavage complex 2 protein Pcf11-like isoform X2 [Halichondria panicea]|uniref:pre-mRNA cleavage complex 2 protein Pcf11-like isoform X2 n=1 Tax=Halichondria panicea TaxID=6063 RepID=UPI00312BBBCC
MAKLSSTSVEKSLKAFSASLEDLTFNSKPIIDELTRFAGSYNQLAPQVVQRVEEHILEVRPDKKLPSLYLLDSILKNVKGEYLQLFSKNIVHIFCHCFEKLVNPDSRKALYKLRLTWPQYIENRKLALIDKHVKALDPNWPVTAVQEDPPSPTIFVNPKFLEPSGKSSSVPNKTSSRNHDPIPVKNRSSPKPTIPVTVEVPSIEKKSSPRKVHSKKKEVQLTIQEKRKKLLQEKKSQRIKQQQEALGLSPERKRRGGESSRTPPRSRDVSPLTVPSPRARSASPRTMADKNSASTTKLSSHPGKVNTDTKEVTPPPEKRPKLDPDQEHNPEPKPVVTDPKEVASNETAKMDTDAPKMDTGATSSADIEHRPLKGSHLQLDDIPPELLPKHHELILKQIQAQLNSGSLSSEQHSTLCKQLDHLYELQNQKEMSIAKTQKDAEQTVDNNDKRSVPSDEFISLSGTNSDLPFFVDAHGSSSSNNNSDFGPNQDSHHDYRGRPRPQNRFYSRRPPQGPYRGDPRPPFRGRHRPPWPNRRPRGPSGRYFNEFDGPPPHMGRGRGRMMSGPPPPNWQESPQGGSYPPHGSAPPPSVDVSNLINQLVGYGMIRSDGSAKGQDVKSAPATVPTLSFTPATLKQRYSALIDVLHVGEQCGTCGIRFSSSSSEEYEKHLDWHYSLNRSEGQTNTSRNWFIHPEDWLKFEELSEDSQEKEATLKPPGEPLEEEEVTASSGEAVSSCLVLLGEDNEVCTICQEPLEQFWEEDLEEWHYKDATRIQLSGKLYHTFCFQDAKEDDLNASNNSAQPSSPEVKVLDSQ